MPTVVRIDGEPVASDQATVSVFDRGFLYGQAAFETLRTYDGVPFAVEAHLERLAYSAEHIGIQPPEQPRGLVGEILELHRSSGHRDSVVRITLTAGRGPLGLSSTMLASPRRISWAYPPPAKPAHWWTEGARAILDRGPGRAERQVKSHAYLPSLLAVQRAQSQGAEEALVVDVMEEVHEGASSNVFIVKSGVVCTPPLQGRILPGVTRQAVIRGLRQDGLPVREEPIRVRHLLDADEVFITSSIREIVPITRIDDHTIGQGHPGAWTETARHAFRRQVDHYIAKWNARGGPELT